METMKARLIIFFYLTKAQHLIVIVILHK